MTATLPEAATGRRAVLPSPGRGRFVLLIFTLLVAGTGVGYSVYLVLYASIYSGPSTCNQYIFEVPRGGSELTAEQEALYQLFTECITLERLGYDGAMFAGAGLVLGVGLVLARVLPRRLVRRAGRTRLAGPRWQEMARDAVASMGGLVVPEVRFGPFTLHEPFSVRSAGKLLVILPPAVQALPAGQARAVLRHECAHVVAGDVGLVWLTSAVLRGLPAMLLLPIPLAFVVALADPDLTVPGMFVGDYYWLEYGVSALLLSAAALAVSAAVVRSREHEADLRAVEGESSEPLLALLQRPDAPHRSWWQRRLAAHPSFSARRAVLDRGDLLRHGRVVEAAAFGLLVGMCANASEFMLMPLLQLVDDRGASSLMVAPVVLGTLLAIGWGLALWRSAASGAQGRNLGALVALPSGVLAGSAANFGGLAQGGVPFGSWSRAAEVFVAVACAAALSLALATSWAGRVRSPRSVFLLNMTLWVPAMWLGLYGWDHLFGGAPLWMALNYVGNSYAVTAGTAVLGVLAWWWTPRRLVPAVAAVLSVGAALIVRVLTPVSIPSSIAPEDVALLDPVSALDSWTAVAAGLGCLIGFLVLRATGAAVATAITATALTGATVMLLGRFAELPGWIHYWQLNLMSVRIHVEWPVGSLASLLFPTASVLLLITGRRKPAPLPAWIQLTVPTVCTILSASIASAVYLTWV
ncbi:Zn-dependent protease with chaperone function [Saccharothrix ecbatanensis]|uniref:Zn-dependent protease with chaperone function n=1 Tax=Saccharothrix ecbatanensis TaxID=1105145 RepID=A0A7W9HVA9_9PSEU|nr:M48 family metalloprotease [Saccharothrix ecbatanensis]MBB5808876.1 Zn-dependent protease with chaperone function [Saccharothrix ecbatanensis]